MSKKGYLVAGIFVFILVVGGSVVFAISRNNQSNPTTLNKARANSSTTPPVCLAESDNPNLKVDSQDQTYIVNAVIANIIDVPAGTNVDVHIKTYDSVTATGSSVYAGNYGSYNFTAKKTGTETTNSYQGNWKVTEFLACK